jgi:hypothetical protein
MVAQERVFSRRGPSLSNSLKAAFMSSSDESAPVTFSAAQLDVHTPAARAHYAPTRPEMAQKPLITVRDGQMLAFRSD